jgi:hypothetical protein
MKIYQAVQKLLVGGANRQTQTDRQTGDLISLLSFFGKKATNHSFMTSHIPPNHVFATNTAIELIRNGYNGQGCGQLDGVPVTG